MHIFYPLYETFLGSHFAIFQNEPICKTYFTFYKPTNISVMIHYDYLLGGTLQLYWLELEQQLYMN